MKIKFLIMFQRKLKKKVYRVTLEPFFNQYAYALNNAINQQNFDIISPFLKISLMHI